MNEDRKKRGLANGKFFTAVAICALFLGSGNVMAAQTASPFAGKKFKIVTYQGDKEFASQAITIESQLELKTTLDEIKQFNIAQEELVKSGYTQKSILVKKLITE